VRRLFSPLKPKVFHKELIFPYYEAIALTSSALLLMLSGIIMPESIRRSALEFIFKQLTCDMMPE
jgi:hypothetical protein